MMDPHSERDAAFGMQERRRDGGSPHLSICAACGNYIAFAGKYWTDGKDAWCSIECTHNGRMQGDKIKFV